MGLAELNCLKTAFLIGAEFNVNIVAIRGMCLIIPLTSWGTVGVYYLQTVGKGGMLLLLTFLKEIVFTYGFMIFFASLDFAGNSISYGVTIGYIIGAAVIYLYSRYEVKKVIRVLPVLMEKMAKMVPMDLMA